MCVDPHNAVVEHKRKYSVSGTDAQINDQGDDQAHQPRTQKEPDHSLKPAHVPDEIGYQKQGHRQEHHHRRRSHGHEWRAYIMHKNIAEGFAPDERDHYSNHKSQQWRIDRCWFQGQPSIFYEHVNYPQAQKAAAQQQAHHNLAGGAGGQAEAYKHRREQHGRQTQFDAL